MLKARKLFTPGPVPIEKHILGMGAVQPPYNRTTDFSAYTQEILQGLGHVFQTSSSVAILTGSGTAAMEAAVLNFLDVSDKVLIINGGTFGQRWCDLCDVHSISYTEFKLNAGEDVDLNRLSEALSSEKFTSLLINAHETSTGQLYDIQSIGCVVRKFDLLYIVDAISTICADPFFMDDWGVDVTILSSQKALALPPGLSFVAMSDRAQSRLKEIVPKSLYFNLQDYLNNQARGQLPYTPAIGILMQLSQRLFDIKERTLPTIISQHKQRAYYFRKSIADMQLNVLPARQSNAITTVLCKKNDAFDIVQSLSQQYGIEVAPSGGELKHKIFRISHMGAQNDSDVDDLIRALTELTHPI
jgi:aspartate aminotransferase-like enzyme